MKMDFLENDVLFGSFKAKEHAGDYYPEMRTIEGLFILDEKKGPMLCMIGQDPESHNPHALKVVIANRNTNAQVVFYTHAIYVEKYGKNNVRITNGDVFLTDTIKSITKAKKVTTLHNPLIVEWDEQELADATFRYNIAQEILG